MRFSRDTIDLFAFASHDVNPLHMSDTYARSSPYGSRVVHGACAALACCGEVTLPDGYIPSRLKTVFYQPVFVDIDYCVRVWWSTPQQAVVTLLDGTMQVLEMILDFAPGGPHLLDMSETAAPPLTAARVIAEEDLAGSCTQKGQYSPPGVGYRRLLEYFKIGRAAWGDNLFFTLLATSYLTGMEMPGERAMYFQLKADFTNRASALPASFRQELVSFDPRWGMVKSHFYLETAGSGPLANGEIQAFLRPLPTGITALPHAATPHLLKQLTGKIVVVIGASRGLGAHLALTFAAAGAKVIGLYARSLVEAERLQQLAAGLPGHVELRQCDASEVSECQKIMEELKHTHGRLDWLVCAAAPLPLSLRIEANTFERIENFITHGLRLVLAPLSASIGWLADSGGSVLLVSSIFVEDPPPIWPQYVTLKCAVEGLARVAAVEYPGVSVCIARPSKLLTDMTNTPIGRVKAEDPASAALRLVSEAVDKGRPGVVSYIK